MLHGVLLIALFACAAFYIGGMDCVKALSFSPMVVGIIIGMLMPIVYVTTCLTPGYRASSFAASESSAQASSFMVSSSPSRM